MHKEDRGQGWATSLVGGPYVERQSPSWAGFGAVDPGGYWGLSPQDFILAPPQSCLCRNDDGI